MRVFLNVVYIILLVHMPLFNTWASSFKIETTQESSSLQLDDPNEIWLMHHNDQESGPKQIKALLELRAKQENKPLHIKDIHFSHFKIAAKSKLTLPKLIIGFDTGGLEAMKELAPKKSANTHFIYIGQFWCDWIRQISPQTDLVILPKQAIYAKHQGQVGQAKLALLTGVVHSQPKDKYAKVGFYWEHESTLNKHLPVPKAKRYLGVFLGGDRKRHEFKNLGFLTVDDAKALATEVAFLAKQHEATILLTNDFVTGLFNKPSDWDYKDSLIPTPQLPTNPGAHENVQLARDEPSDSVSGAFIDTLKNKKASFYFWDSRTTPGYMDAHDMILDKIITTPESILVITGDDTQRISEASEVLVNHRLYVARIEDLGHDHKQHIDHLDKTTPIDVFSTDLKWPTLEESTQVDRIPGIVQKPFLEQAAELIWPHLPKT